MTIGRVDINEKDLSKICTAIIQLEERQDKVSDFWAGILDDSDASAITGGGGGGVAAGRLTLQTATPVMTTTQSGKTTIYYTPYIGSSVQLYDGSTFTTTAFTELSNVTTNSATGSAGPAAVAASSVYDLFVWSNGGTPTLTRGPAWTSDTTRSAGTALTMVSGVLLNSVSITNGPAASRGTYVGTIRSNGSSQLDWIYAAVGTPPTAGFIGVWNAYNRRSVSMQLGEATDAWTYNSVVIRAMNGNTSTARISFVTGLSEDVIEAYVIGSFGAPAAGLSMQAVGLDSTSSFAGTWGLSVNQASNTGSTTSVYAAPLFGFHFLSANEAMNSANVGNFYGDNGGIIQTGLTVKGWF